jgi:hypothetical protein
LALFEVVLGGAAQEGLQLLGVPGLGDVLPHEALVEAADNHVDVRVTGDEDADRGGVDGLELAEELDAGHLRHALVAEDQMDLLVAEDLQRLGAGVRVWTLNMSRKLSSRVLRMPRSSSTMSRVSVFLFSVPIAPVFWYSFQLMRYLASLWAVSRRASAREPDE